MMDLVPYVLGHPWMSPWLWLASRGAAHDRIGDTLEIEIDRMSAHFSLMR